MPLVFNDGLTLYTIVTHADKAVDVPAGKAEDGLAMQQWSRNKSKAQLWYVDPCGNNDMVRFVNRASGRVLDVRDGGPEGKPVQQFAWAANDNQRFQIEDVGGGFVVLTLAANHDLVVDVSGASGEDGAAIIAWSRNGGDNQRFRLIP